MPTYETVTRRIEASEWVPGKKVAGVLNDRSTDGDTAYCITAHGQRTKIVSGDFIVAEPDGRGHYPIKPDIFKKNYKLVD